MKRTFFALALMFVGMAHTVAQTTPLRKYDVVPVSFEYVFVDHIKDFQCQLIDVSGGQYVGQTDNKHMLYGFGQFVNNDGGLIIGKFRAGELLQGISLGAENVTVGNKQFYCSYSLSTGRLEYVFEDGKLRQPTAQEAEDYAFMTMTFDNGDSYVGELYKGKRHGLGIYYYAKGGLWYGAYEGDLRNGFGAWFKPGNDMLVGLWEGEDERYSVYIPLAQ